MNKKQKILIIVLLLVMSYSIFEISKVKVQIDLVDVSISPYNTYGDSNRSISLLGADDTDLIMNQLMELSDDTKVSFILPVRDSSQENSTNYYWYLQDDKYLSGDIILNKSLDVEKFNTLEDPITNHSTDEYYFNFPMDTYNYKIYPFHHYDQSNISSTITIFADSDKRLDEFIVGLNQLEILHVVNEPFENQGSFLQTISLVFFENPLSPLTFGLFLIVIFTALYQDRRNLSIKLVNGYSKTRYILENLKNFLLLQTIIFIASFLAFYLLTYYFNFKHFLSMLSYYIPIVLMINITVMILISIIIYSFTDINQTTYVQGIKGKVFTSYIIGVLKFTIALLICLSLIPSISNIINTSSIYQSMSKQMDKFSDTYIIASDGEYTTTIIQKSDEIIEALEGFDNVIYQSHFNSENERTNKLVKVNENYLKRHPILDQNNNPIDRTKMNVVYTKAYNEQWVEELKPFDGFLCESEDNCLDVETIIIHEDTELTMYNMDPLVDNGLISQDFALVPQNKGFFILQLFFVFENENQIQDVRNILKDIIDVELLTFEKVTERWEGEIDIYRNIIIKDSIRIMNYLILMVILSLIYYQIKFDKVRKKFSIYWVNGISKFNYFYIDYFYQIILSGIMIMLVKIKFYPDISITLILTIYFIFIIIDSMSLVIFRNRFYRQLQKNIKEQM